MVRSRSELEEGRYSPSLTSFEDRPRSAGIRPDCPCRFWSSLPYWRPRRTHRLRVTLAIETTLSLRSVRYQFGNLPKDLGVLQTHTVFLFTLRRDEGGTLAGSDRCFPAHSAIMNLASESSENSLMMSR